MAGSTRKSTTAKSAKSEPKAPAAKPAPAKPKPGLTKAQLTKAAKMRDDAATWNAIREAFGVKLGPSGWFRAWEREGITHRPAGERVKPKAEPAKEA